MHPKQIALFLCVNFNFFLLMLLCFARPMTTIDATLHQRRATSVRFAVPRRRLNANNVDRCSLAVVSNVLNPLAWLYAAGDEGLPEDGLPVPSLTTAGYDDDLFVYQWQGESEQTVFSL